LWRARAFADLGADILFVEAPQTEEELAAIPEKVRGLHMANMIAGGVTPVVPPRQLESMGYRIAAYPLIVLGAAIEAIREALSALRDNGEPREGPAFADIKRIVGFDEYQAMEARYSEDKRESR
jgi:2-methylisocitrate lyase-like PEP mutase family enzyme